MKTVCMFLLVEESIYFRIVTVFRTVLYYFQTSQSLVQSNTVDSRNQGIQGKTSVKALFALLFFGVLVVSHLFKEKLDINTSI